MVVISAVLKVKAGKEETLVEEMKALAKAVKENEPDTLDYVLHRSQKDPLTFMIYEKYKSGQAVQAHMTSAHFQAAAKKFPELLDGGMAIEMYDVIE